MKSISTLFTAIALTTFLPLAAMGKPAGDEAERKSVEVTEANFEEVVLKADHPVLVDFWAEWCGPCHVIAPTLEEIAADYEGKVTVAKIDVDATPQLASRYQIRAIPNLKIFKDGKVVDQIAGVVPKATIAEKLDAQL